MLLFSWLGNSELDLSQIWLLKKIRFAEKYSFSL